MDLNGDAESTGFHTPLSSPAHSRAAKLRRTLRDSPETDLYSTSSSPPTGVTQVYAPLYQEDDGPPDSPVARPSPHFTFTSSSSRAYPVVFDGRLLETGLEEMPLQLEVSDWDSLPPTPLFSDLHPGAEEHTSKPPRCMPLHPDPPLRSIGVEYRSLSDLTDMESVDSRVWLPKPRVFNPGKVKPRPLTRPPSPEKKNASLLHGHETVGSSPQVRRQISLVDSPFVRADRGRYSRFTADSSLPILPNRELEDKCSGCGSCLTQLLENHRAGKGKEKEPDRLVRDKNLAERSTGYAPRNEGRSHVQLVPRDGRDEESAIIVHCPPNCPHETCYRSPVILPVPGIEPSRPSGSRYVDACVSPIIAITGHIENTDSSAKIRFKGPDLDGDHLDHLAGLTQISHRGIALETDVRSPIVKGTMIPMNAAE